MVTLGQCRRSYWRKSCYLSLPTGHSANRIGSTSPLSLPSPRCCSGTCWRSGARRPKRAEYLQRLQRYGEHVGHPVLLAWKHRPSGFWRLCELRHFARARQNYNLRFNDAMIHTLMSILAGDFTFTLVGGLAWHLKLRKLDPGVTLLPMSRAYSG